MFELQGLVVGVEQSAGFNPPTLNPRQYSCLKLQGLGYTARLCDASCTLHLASPTAITRHPRPNCGNITIQGQNETAGIWIVIIPPTVQRVSSNSMSALWFVIATAGVTQTC